MASKTKAEVHKALAGQSVTDGWDVLVSYSSQQLNALLKDQWNQSGKFEKVNFKYSFGDGKRAATMIYNLELSAPDLQFQTSRNPMATLLVPIKGSYYYDDEPEEVKPIPEGAFTLRLEVPIASVTGDETEHKSNDKVIEFDDGKPGAFYFVFHFDNNKHIQWRLDRHHERQDNPTMEMAASQIILWLQSEKNVRWVDYKVAQVSNSPDGDDGVAKLLQPKSFCFSTQEGALNVFIQTKAPNSKPGKAVPRLNSPGSEEVLCIPQGYEAVIILSSRLFLDDYLIPQITENFTNLVKPDSTKDVVPVKEVQVKSGLAFSLYVDFSKAWSLGHADNGMVWKNLKIDKFTVDFRECPLKLIIEDDAKTQVPVVSWSWDFSKELNWEVDKAGPHGPLGFTEIGRVKLSAQIDTEKSKRNFATIKGDELALKVNFVTQTDGPHMNPPEKIKREPGFFEKEGGIPKEFKDVEITLKDFGATFPPLNFFVTQNIFVPGKRFINVTDVMIPHDVLLLGQMAKPGQA